MDSSAAYNPYEVAPEDEAQAPFVDRAAALTRLRKQLADPSAPSLVVLGRTGVGKTALLRQIDATGDDALVTIVVPLDDTPLDGEGDWLLALAQSATEELVRREFTLSRLSTLQPPGNDPRAWLNNAFLSEFLATIRPQRRAAFLLDDADLLIDAIDRGTLPTSTLAYLLMLKQLRPQIAFVATLDAKREADLPRLQPLIDGADIIRLADLPLEATADLLRTPVSGLYYVSDDAVDTIHRATGGYPPFVRAFGSALFRRQRAAPNQVTVTIEDVKAVTQDVYAQAAPHFAKDWSTLAHSERLVLGAISTLTYDDPLRVLDTQAIEEWLVETDFPLDATTINAALRSLEYRELVSPAGNGGHAIHAAMMQRWLLENARPGEPTRPGERPRPPLRWVVVAIFAVVIIGLAVLLSRTNAPENRPSGDAPPTVTLIGP